MFNSNRKGQSSDRSERSSAKSSEPRSGSTVSRGAGKFTVGSDVGRERITVVDGRVTVIRSNQSK